jgi:large subunit ribosomal protein L17
MRHRHQGKKLNRDSSHRQALFKNLIKSLVAKEEIKTTESKAKVVRKIFEKLITRGKEQSLSARRLIHAFLQDKKAVGKLVDRLSPLFKGRKGGFTRIVRLGQRRGDNAMMVRLELVKKTGKPEAPSPPEKSKKRPKPTPKEKTKKS